MQNIQYGYKVPESGDKGAGLFDALENNINLTAVHKHNGTDAEKIITTDLDKLVVNLSSLSWGAVSNGYKQTVTCPGSATLDKSVLRFRIRSGAGIHKYINPTVIPLSLTQFEVIVNVPSLDLEVLFI